VSATAALVREVLLDGTESHTPEARSFALALANKEYMKSAAQYVFRSSDRTSMQMSSCSRPTERVKASLEMEQRRFICNAGISAVTLKRSWH